ncbi:nuclear pore complex subunit [Pestalotiopsis sp. IQ-011]
MSYQYPPPPQNGGDLDLPHSGYLSNYQTSAASSLEVRNQQVPGVHLTQPVLPAQGSMSLAQRRDKINNALKLRRPETTPNVRTQGTNESAHGQFGSAGEKKRNKLGYHRTSVACTHCRRRKIRCIPYVNDPQGRCQNCIRLKKECTFHSVGQDIPPSNAQRPGARTGPGPKIASASTSPVATTGHQSAISPSHPYPITSVSSLQNMGPPIKPESFPRDSKLSTSTPTTRNFQYGHNANNWVPTDTGANPAKTPDMNNSWRSYTQDSPVTPGFSSYTTHPHSTSPWPSAAMTPVSNESTSRHDEIAWSPYPTPGRSLSYGGENSQNYAPVASHVAAGSTGPNTVYDQRRSSIHAAGSDMYQPHNAGIVTTIPNVESIPGTALDPNGPLSAGAVPTQGYGAWQQPTYTYPKSGDGGAYESWYGSSGQAGGQVPSNTDHSPQSVYYASR